MTVVQLHDERRDIEAFQSTLSFCLYANFLSGSDVLLGTRIHGFLFPLAADRIAPFAASSAHVITLADPGWSTN